jgi:hypothetical protein
LIIFSSFLSTASTQRKGAKSAKDAKENEGTVRQYPGVNERRCHMPIAVQAGRYPHSFLVLAFLCDLRVLCAFALGVDVRTLFS